MIEIEIALAKSRETYTDEHPVVKNLLVEKEELMKKMETTKEEILSSKIVTAAPDLTKAYIQGRINVAGLEARREAIEKYHAKMKNMLEGLPDDLFTYGQLMREQKVAEQVYLLLVSQLEQAKIAEANENNIQINVIDPPVVPYRKHSPSTVLNMAIAGFLALFMGVGWAFFKEYYANSFSDGGRRLSR